MAPLSFLTKVPGGLPALTCFVVSLVAYVVQTELTGYVQSTLGYRKPYFMLYLSHSSFTFLFPLHLLFLKLNPPQIHTRPASTIRQNLWDLREALRIQFSLSFASSTAKSSDRSQRREPSRRGSSTRLLPNGGGGINTTVESDDDEEEEPEDSALLSSMSAGAHPNILLQAFPTRRFVSSLVLLTALLTIPSLTWYMSVRFTTMTTLTLLYNTSTIWAWLFSLFMLPRVNLWGRSDWRMLLCVIAASVGAALVTISGSPVVDDSLGAAASRSDTTTGLHWVGNLGALFGASAYGFYEVFYKLHYTPPPSRQSLHLPLFLQTNAITSLIGLLTLTLLALPLPVLDWLGWETFELPKGGRAAVCVAGVSLGGLAFNASFMILLSFWGPVAASISNLLTTLLVTLVDSVLTATPSTDWNIKSVSGAILVLASFGGLCFDMMEDEGGGGAARYDVAGGGDEDVA